MKKLIQKSVLAAAVTGALALASSAAMAQTFPDFTVNEGSVAGASANTFTADKITGNYTEVITFGASNTFNVSLMWNAGQFVANNGSTPVPTQLGQTGSVVSQQYGLYALYSGNGTYNTTNGVTTFSFTPGGSLSVYIDPNSNTTFTQAPNGSSPWTRANNTDDYLIGTGMPTSGLGTLDPSLSTCGASNGINCGSFGSSTSFNLTSAGSQYFISPNPFYNVSFQSGQFNNIGLTGTQIVNGSMDVIFGGTAVPEPASIALIGLGLMGLGLSRRKKQA